MPKFQIENFIGGLNSSQAKHKVGDTDLTLCENFFFDRLTIGSAKKRAGYAKHNATEWPEAVGLGIRGIHKFFRSVTGIEDLIVAGGTKWGRFSASAFIDITFTPALTTDVDTNFVTGVETGTEVDILIGANGADRLKKYISGTTGANLGGTSVVASTLAVYKEHLFHNNVAAPNKLIFSAPGDHEDFLVASGGGDFQVGQNSGDKITALVAQANRLLVFKNDEVWAVYGNDDTTFRAVQLYDSVGCPTPKGVAELDGVIVFVHASGGRTQIFSIGNQTFNPPLRSLSDKIQTTLDDETSAGFLTTAVAIYNRQIWVAYSELLALENSAVLFLASDFNAWSKFTNMPFSAFYTDDKTGSNRLFAGDTDNGFVFVLDTGTQDDGTNITARLRTKYFDFGRIDLHKYQGTVQITTDYKRGDTFEARVISNNILGELVELPRVFKGLDNDDADIAVITWEPPLSVVYGPSIGIEIRHANNEAFTLHGINLDEEFDGE